MRNLAWSEAGGWNRIHKSKLARPEEISNYYSENYFYIHLYNQLLYCQVLF
jgi:hypothetical protein